MPTSTGLPRPGGRRARQLTGCLLGVVVAMLLAACGQAGRASTATPTFGGVQTPFVVPALPGQSFTSRYGTSPVAAADALALQRSEAARAEYWEVALRADPSSAGFVDAGDPVASRTARGHFTSLLVIIASESLPTLRGMLTGGDAGQKAYCIRLLDQLRGEGYNALSKATVWVFFGENDHHSTLEWTQKAGYTYTIYDNNLNGALTTPPPSATPFATPLQR